MEGKSGSNRRVDGGREGGHVIKNDFIEMEREREGGWWLYAGTRRERSIIK